MSWAWFFGSGRPLTGLWASRASRATRGGPNPTDRAKQGTKKSVIVEQRGGPLGVAIDGANIHDTKLLAATIEAVVVKRPDPAEVAQHLCLDKAYDNPTGKAACEAGSYVPHIRRIGEEKLDIGGEKTHPARRWVVERTIAWLQRCRALLIRYDKKARNYLGLSSLPARCSGGGDWTVSIGLREFSDSY
jgi:putative transposase